MAYHLGQVSRFHLSKEIYENDLSNFDETHFFINIYIGRKLGFAGDSEVKNADVVSGVEDISMMIRLSGGRDARIESSFIIFTNKNFSNLIRGVPYDTPGVSGPKSWIDIVLFHQYLQDRIVIRALPNGRKLILFINNCSGHILTASAGVSMPLSIPKSAIFHLAPLFLSSREIRFLCRRQRQHFRERGKSL